MFQWLIADGFIPDTSCGRLESHESLCIVNPHSRDALIKIEIFFEHREPISGIELVCPARRTRHIRVDQLTAPSGTRIPRGVPYAMALTSELEIGVQLSRLDSSQAQLALMTVSGIRIGV
ncbi:sensory rhodopsin transducer [Alicyclobacillus sendaiensis]|uniref:Sensory rhodopsin transducer n=1 Tax=Alicyclobacillus sendaiensis PA2 TaxID=3029425 RepID=A0ABT6XYA6_ALISE|nr:sensory rhodopsin transducer [Alicyclobacillus sendaiensis]MDI9260081.1 sensory rhodopsin transducer [Alicyclobacillus sendaiensis PA2]